MINQKKYCTFQLRALYIFDIAKSSSYTGKSLRKKSMLENFRANVLKQRI